MSLASDLRQIADEIESRQSFDGRLERERGYPGVLRRAAGVLESFEEAKACAYDFAFDNDDDGNAVECSLERWIAHAENRHELSWGKAASRPARSAPVSKPEPTLRNRWLAMSAGDRAALAPSGRICVEPGCDKPAGTPWGPYWCPDCDDKRMDRISASLEGLFAAVTPARKPSHE